MSYKNYLRDLLGPLGVYDLREESFSGGEIEALGAALDELWAEAQRACRESVPATAEDEGLRRWEELFPHRAPADTVEARRAALSAFLTIGGDSFTAAALSRSLSASGVRCLVEETGTPETVEVSFPETMGEPGYFAAVREIIEEILPCHLGIRYRLKWCTWGEAAALTWGEAGEMDWYGLETWQNPAAGSA